MASHYIKLHHSTQRHHEWTTTGPSIQIQHSTAASCTSTPWTCSPWLHEGEFPFPVWRRGKVWSFCSYCKHFHHRAARGSPFHPWGRGLGVVGLRQRLAVPPLQLQWWAESEVEQDTPDGHSNPLTAVQGGKSVLWTDWDTSESTLALSFRARSWSQACLTKLPANTHTQYPSHKQCWCSHNMSL